jgi:hypothetical protein
MLVKAFDRTGQHLHLFAVALDAAPGKQHDAVTGGPSVSLEDLRLDDEIGDSCLIFARDQKDARRRARCAVREAGLVALCFIPRE